MFLIKVWINSSFANNNYQSGFIKLLVVNWFLTIKRSSYWVNLSCISGLLWLPLLSRTNWKTLARLLRQVIAIIMIIIIVISAQPIILSAIISKLIFLYSKCQHILVSAAFCALILIFRVRFDKKIIIKKAKTIKNFSILFGAPIEILRGVSQSFLCCLDWSDSQ